jgi:hypothetical protein
MSMYKKPGHQGYEVYHPGPGIPTMGSPQPMHDTNMRIELHIGHMTKEKTGGKSHGKRS